MSTKIDFRLEVFDCGKRRVFKVTALDYPCALIRAMSHIRFPGATPDPDVVELEASSEPVLHRAYYDTWEVKC